MSAPRPAPAATPARYGERVVHRSPDVPRVLLVDDRPENLLALEAILEPLNLVLVRAHSGEEALKHVLQQEFAVILLDVQMPGLNGFETAQIIKSRERSRAIPIIFLTAISKEEEYVFKGYEVGAVDYMFKPFQPDILRSKVLVFVDLYRQQQQLKRQEEQLREGERRELELRHRAELLEREARLEEIVGSAMDAIVTFDADLRVTLFNAAAERMFGRPAAEVVGERVGALFPPDVRDAQVRALCAAGGGEGGDCAPGAVPGEPRLESLVGARAGGETFPLEASVSCLSLGEGRLYTLIARDVSERKRAEEALRTPINAIIGYNTLLLDHIYGPLNERQEQGLQRTHKAARHLLELVNDVLDLSKIEAGKIELSLQPVPFPGIVEDLFVTVRPLADEHATSLSLDAATQGTTVVSDPRRVRQILLNLLSNAIKFGAGKPIVVECRAFDDGGVEVAVRDHGMGIAPADMARIFDEFVQLAQPQQVTGTGLGLPISKRLAVLLGGELTAESEPGTGSTFRLRLPKSPDAHADGERAPRGAGEREPSPDEPPAAGRGARGAAPVEAASVEAAAPAP